MDSAVERRIWVVNEPSQLAADSLEVAYILLISLVGNIHEEGHRHNEVVHIVLDRVVDVLAYVGAYDLQLVELGCRVEYRQALMIVTVTTIRLKIKLRLANSKSWLEVKIRHYGETLTLVAQ